MKKAISASWLGRLQSAETAFRKYIPWKHVSKFFQSYPGHSKEAQKSGSKITRSEGRSNLLTPGAKLFSDKKEIEFT